VKEEEERAIVSQGGGGSIHSEAGLYFEKAILQSWIGREVDPREKASAPEGGCSSERKRGVGSDRMPAGEGGKKWI